MKVALLITCFILASLAIGCNLSSFSSDVMAEISAHSWRKTLVIEQLESKAAEAWENELPKDAKIISKRQEVHHYDGKILAKVPEVRKRKYECGRERIGLKPPFQYVIKYCEEEYKVEVEKEIDDITKPVYAMKVKYEFKIWTEKEKKDLMGYDKDISKVETVEVDNKTTRIAKTDDSFMIELKTPDGRKYPQNVTKEVWEKLNEGQKIKCKIDLNKNLTDCEF